ncbi:MAG TPA: MauE/DoxX family redox-associated membrane protein [Candidatus Saccharimonadales bacterium]|nr:MauE/DoxX family redox-associated membrane protein [Candidatus Saccharimonadales bacterium]
MMESAPFNSRRIVIWLGRLLLGGIFIYAGYSKVFLPNHFYWPLPMLKFSIAANLSNFGFQVDSYKLLSPSGVSFVAHSLPFAEILLGLLLLIGWRLPIWGAIVTLLLAGFVAAVTRAYLLHMNINCGCFAAPEPVSVKKILEDCFMLLLALLMTVFAFQETRRPHPWSAPEKSNA